MSRKRTQLFLMLTVLIITGSIVTLFSILSYASLKRQIVTQILKDNKVLGEHLFQLFNDKLYQEKSPEEQIRLLQKFADEITLPNGGFVCALAPEGTVVAYPGIKPEDKMNIGSLVIRDEKGALSGAFADLKMGQTFAGFLEESPKADQIIYSRPLEGTSLRLNVHQSMKEVNTTIRQLILPLVFIGVTLSCIGVVLVYLLSNQIVTSYESELEVLNRELREINHERKQLLRVLSHDISNPLSVIEMAATLTDISDIENQELHEAMAMITGSVKQAMDIINLNRDMLAFQERKKELKLEPVLVQECVNNMLQVVQSRLNDKDLALDISVEEELKVVVEPVSFLNSVLNNIMTNAVKFSFPHSTILLTAKGQGDKCHIAIKDSGIGMPEELVEKLFHAHEKTSRKGTFDEVGTGFGMPIMKHFVELYGGAVEVESIEGKEDRRIHGTTVHLYIPRVS